MRGCFHDMNSKRSFLKKMILKWRILPLNPMFFLEPESVKLVDKCCLNGKAAMAHEMNRTKCPSPPKKGTKTRPPVGSKF